MHIVPRKASDFKDNDDVYEHIDQSEGELLPIFSGSLPKIEEKDRIARTGEDMTKEAEWLARIFEEE